MPPGQTRLARDSLVYAGGLALQRGLSVLVLPVATRLLAPSQVGIAGAALAVAGVLAIVLGLGFSFAVVRLFHDEEAAAPRTEWAMLARVQLVLAAGLAGAAWLLGPLWSGMFEDVPWSGALQAAVVLGFAQAAQATALGVLRAARRVGAFAAVVTTQVLVGGPASIALAAGKGPAGLVAGLAIGALASAVLGAALTYRRPLWSWRAARRGLALSVPFVAHLLSAWIMGLSDRVLIERFLDLESLAAYHVAYALASLPILATDSVQAAWVPRFYGWDAESKRTFVGRVALPVTCTVAALAAGVVLVAPAAARVLAPADFDVPMTVVALVVSATFVRSSYLLGFAVLSDRLDSRSIARASSAGAALNILANLIAIPAWGLNGAAATTLAAYAVMSALVLRRAEQATGVAISLRRLAAVWAAAAAVMVALGHLPTSPLGWLARLAALTVALMAAARWFSEVQRAYRAMSERSGTPPSTS